MDQALPQVLILFFSISIGKDYVVTGGTDKSIVKIIDRLSLSTLATIKDIGKKHAFEK